MERSSDHGGLDAALAEARPIPREAFVKDLDDRVAAGFPRRSRLGPIPLGSLGDRVRALSPQRLVLAAGGGALVAIALATVVVSSSDSGSAPVAQHADRHPGLQLSKQNRRHAGGVEYLSGASAGSTAEGQSSVRPFSRDTPETSLRAHREIERSAEIGLLADPADVAGDSAKVFAAVHDARGIVLHSTTTAGRDAGARFDLLIPSVRLGDALAAISAIDEVRTRHEATIDITKPTVSLEEMLRDSRAKTAGLLTQLSAAESETEREAIELALRQERHHAAVLRARLSKLRARSDFSHVSVRIESGASPGAGGAWGIDDAFGDAGQILGVAAGITVVSLAILAPLALICLIAWLAHRLWLRTRRERALGA